MEKRRQEKEKIRQEKLANLAKKGKKKIILKKTAEKIKQEAERLEAERLEAERLAKEAEQKLKELEHSLEASKVKVKQRPKYKQFETKEEREAREALEKKQKEATVEQQEIPEGYSELLGLGLSKTKKMPLKGNYMTEDLFGVIAPAVLKGKGNKVVPKKLLKALLGDGVKLKKVAKPNDARRIRGQKVKELMKKEGLTLAQASKKLKMMG
jgi:hypothetical protein